MEGKDIRGNTENNRTSDREAGTTEKRHSGSTGTADSKGTGTGTGTGTAAGTAAGTEEKKPSPVAILTPPTKEEAKPKRKRVSKKKDDSAFSADQISALIQSVSMIVAGREGLEQWAITKKEADSVAQPLYNILEKSEMLGKIGEHSDAIALTIAAGSIVIPRAMVTIDKRKAKKPKVIKMDNKGVTVHNDIDKSKGSSEPSDKAGESKRPNRSVSGSAAAVHASFDSIPPVTDGIV